MVRVLRPEAPDTARGDAPFREEKRMVTILIVLLVLLRLAQRRPGPTAVAGVTTPVAGGLGLVILFVVILALTGRIQTQEL